MRIIDMVEDPKRRFEEIKKHKNIIMFGAGSKATQTYNLLIQKGVFPNVVCDNNPNLHGKKFENILPIYNYNYIKNNYTNYCFVLSVAINNAIEIIEMLKQNNETASIYHVSNPFKVDQCLLEYSSLLCDEDKYNKVYSMWDDEISKQLYIESLNSKLTGSVLQLFDYVDGDSFFDDRLIGNLHNHTYIDVGAYTGDTICMFLEYSRGKYQRILGFEADKGNFNSLMQFIKFGRIKNVELYNQGVWSEKKNIKFNTTSDNTVINYDSPNFFNDISLSIDQKTMLECEAKGIVPETLDMEVDTLDHLVSHCIPTIMKINALAADYPILLGAKKIIEQHTPIIIMEYGTRPEYLTNMLIFLKEINPNYNFYLRQKMIFGDCKTIFYAVGEKKNEC